ncbi:repeat-containing 44 [Octopus vulgaris]|uniref:Repeat-containing 44 n=3 Tax=Octopus TaxID=6643 RepID=A0AA36BM91_OCTVU|nr:WD repeat-containing protein 44 isoform X1 [Octopus sinensis]CAI9737026.1 repeat-containing 44 [Octopus vulgaris]
MSSDSELDEFYDAEDHSPELHNVSPESVDLPKQDGTSTEAESSSQLLQTESSTFERKSCENNELGKMLEELHRKKQLEDYERVEAERKVLENRKRRRKVELLRQALSEDKSPLKNDSEDLFKDFDVPGNTDKAEASLHPADFDINNIQLSSKSSSNDLMSKNVCPPTLSLSSPLLEQSSSSLAQTSAGHPFTDISMTVTVPEKFPTTGVLQDPYYAASTDMCLKNNMVSLVAKDNEPDIIQSAKPRNLTPPSTMDTKSQNVLPSTLNPPVAPPRRKRRPKNLSTSHENLSMYCVSPAELLTPVSTVECLTKELQHSLDLQSALEGSRIINAEEAESGAVNSDQDSVSPIMEQNTLSSLESDGVLLRQKSLQDFPKSNSLPSDYSQMLRPRSNSGRSLTDQEILESVYITNLDTGQKVPLSVAEDELPRCINPLDLHIIQRTHEYLGEGEDRKTEGSEEDECKSENSRSLSDQHGTKSKATKIKKFIGKTVGKTMNRVKSVADQSKKVLQGDEAGIEEEYSIDGKIYKIKVSSSNKGPWDFSQPRLLQDLSGEHSNAIWTMKFSPCGRLLATGGQDSVLRIWILKNAYLYFEDLGQKYADKMSPSTSRESLDSTTSSETSNLDKKGIGQTEDEYKNAPFVKKPFCTYRGHSADLLDISWSKNYFILSSSMDKTVRLWHISRRECLCTFQHIDFVTAIVFHPKDDRYFLSGSLDGKLRLWNIPDKKVTLWNEVSSPSNLITTANFCNNGKYAVVGTYDGKCIFFTTEQLKYSTQIHVRSTRGKNAKGRKVTGIEPLHGEDKILVTTNDSRIRLYDLRDLTLTCKYKGGTNNSSQIKASFSTKGKYIICGSEDHFIYLWKTHHDYYKFSSARRDRNDYWEAIKVHNAVVTVAVLAPNPQLMLKSNTNTGTSSSDSEISDEREIIVSADFTGAVKVMQCRIKNSA